MSDDAHGDSSPADWISKVLVPSIGTVAALVAAAVSSFLVWYTNDRTSQIQERLSAIQQDQFASEQSAKLGQFNRESERQYVALVYNDLLAKDKDPVRQKGALSLLQVLAPDTGLKLLAWAQQANVILPQNRAESLAVENRLETLQTNGRFRLFLHVGRTKGRPVPEVDAIRKALSADGYGVLGIDSKTDDYGPGVDYFDDSTKLAAENVAKILSTLLPGGASPIAARKQNAPNREGTIGIWF